MARGRAVPPDVRVVDARGAVDASALQRHLDRLTASAGDVSSPAVSGLASADIDVIRTEADPTASPGRSARIGSLLLRIRPDVGSVGYYVKSGPLDTDWDRLIQSGERASVMFPPFAQSSGASKTLTSGTCFAIYMGRVPTDVTSWDLRWRVSTAGASVTWAEVAIATGALDFAASTQMITIRGYRDVATAITSTGTKTTTIVTPEIPAGTDVWVVFAEVNTLTTPIISAFLGDSLGMGIQAALTGGFRPSQVLGRPLSLTTEALGTAAPNVMLGL